MESKPLINFTTPSPAPSTTIPDLISQLRSAFRPSEFDKVEQILIDRESNLKRTLKEMSVEIDNRKREFDLSMLEIEDELKKYKREYDELREKITRFDEDRKLYGDREKRAEERYAKLLRDSKKAENDRKEVILQLKESNSDLKSKKRRAEVEVEGWKEKFRELEVRVLRLEEDTGMLMSGDPLLQRKIKEESRPVFDEIMGVKEKTYVDTGNAKLFQSHNKDDESNGHERIHNSPGDGSTCNSPVMECSALQEAAAMRKQSVIELGSSTKMMTSSVAGSGRPGLQNIIEIDDSDDERPAGDGIASVSNVCVSDLALGEKQMTSQKFVNIAYSENSHEASMPKRKRICEWDDDDKSPIGKRKMKILEELGNNCEASVNHGLAIPDLGVTDVAHAVPPSSHNPIYIRPCEEKHEAKHTSQIPSSSSDSSDSSDSGDENDTDSYMDQMIADIRRKRENKVWAFKVDMLMAFQRNPELCMNAVCALYRQRTSKETSVKDPMSSNNRGFNQFDALRGTALAEFLVAGDPQGKLRKSVSELQQYDPKALDDCAKLATRYSEQLFEIYRRKEDPFFLPP